MKIQFIKRMRKLGYIILLSICGLWLSSCDKAGDAPHNPYDDVVYITPPAPVDTLQTNSMVWLQKNIFETRCAAPGCHDGNFEPDFRTIESSFATLVYHPIVKNNRDSTFKYRVVPYDTANSVLHERLTNCCFVGTNDRMPQDNIGVPLQQNYIDAITAWILSGAPDMMGQVKTLPNLKPSIDYYLAANADYTVDYSTKNNRIDSVNYNPFMVSTGTVINMVLFVSDDNTPLNQLLYNKLRTSYSTDDFSTSAPGYSETTATFVNLGGAGQYWIATLNSSNFAVGSVVYMRYYTEDNAAGPIVEMPSDDKILPYKTYWSFYIRP